jgi:hypothetical protein
LNTEESLRISVKSKPASIEELVAVPNVTAIDWKQADVYGPSFEQKGGMSFTVQEARAVFFRVLLKS